MNLEEYKNLATESINKFGTGYIFIFDGNVTVREYDNPDSKRWATAYNLPSRQIENYIDHLVSLGCKYSTDMKSKGWV